MIDLDLGQMEQLLAEARIGRLSMADTQMRPYTIPLPFCWLNGALYLRLPLTGRKGQILGQNNQVCFEVDRFTDTLDDYASVLIEGRLIEVTDVLEKQMISAANTEKYNRLRQGHRPGHGRATPMTALPLRKVVVRQLSGKRKEPRLPSEQK